MKPTTVDFLFDIFVLRGVESQTLQTCKERPRILVHPSSLTVESNQPRKDNDNCCSHTDSMKQHRAD